MVFAGDIRNAILKMANQRGPGNVFYSAEVARLIDQENWKDQVEQVQLVAESLIHEGKIIEARSEKIVDTAYSKSPLPLEDS